ncbi:MAG: antibiotic biosynthesis monooxygenase [Desulfobacteraceae bacterium]|nr:MAG: antibiotic biosynthesis monooxygenase [Desulfobacteraceae bacterium]
MIFLRITMHVLPEKQKEVVQTLVSMVDPMKKETGCRSYSLFYDMTDKNLLCVLEEWENREKLDHHLESDVFGVLLGTRSLLSQPHDIHIDSVQRAEGMQAVLAARGRRNDGA